MSEVSYLLSNLYLEEEEVFINDIFKDSDEESFEEYGEEYREFFRRLSKTSYAEGSVEMNIIRMLCGPKEADFGCYEDYEDYEDDHEDYDENYYDNYYNDSYYDNYYNDYYEENLTTSSSSNDD